MIEEVRKQTECLVEDAINSKAPVLIESPPASGKTWNAVQLAAKSDYGVTYLASRRDLYKQAEKIAADTGDIRAETIPSPHRDCPTFKGDNDGDIEKVHRLYRKGIRARNLHFKKGREVYTPCQLPDDPCPYIEALDRVQPDELAEIDLLIGNHQHAYNEGYLEDRIVIFDEF